ncbi:MAG: hypothetical protein ACTHOK_02305 [Nocardioidaceae bacterium]
MHLIPLAPTPAYWAAVGAMAQAVATVLTLIVAIFAVRYAAGQVKEARAQVTEARRAREEQSERANQETQERAERDARLREEQARPFVVVDFQPSAVWGNIIEIVFENVGQTLAKDVRFHFSPELESSQGSEGYDFKNSVLIRRGIPSMPPGKRFAALFDLSHERIKTDLPMAYSVRVDMKDAFDRQQPTLEYVLDLNFMYGFRRIDAKTIHDVAKSLKEIETNVGRWTQHFNGLRVWVRDEDAYLERENEAYEAAVSRAMQEAEQSEE